MHRTELLDRPPADVIGRLVTTGTDRLSDAPVLVRRAREHVGDAVEAAGENVGVALRSTQRPDRSTSRRSATTLSLLAAVAGLVAVVVGVAWLRARPVAELDTCRGTRGFPRTPEPGGAVDVSGGRDPDFGSDAADPLRPQRR